MSNKIHVYDVKDIKVTPRSDNRVYKFMDIYCLIHRLHEIEMEESTKNWKGKIELDKHHAKSMMLREILEQLEP